jgi:hypothetical protein
VGLDGTLQPLAAGQVAALKQRCGRGGLRVLALAYKDVLLPAAQPSNGAADATGSNGKGAGSSSGAGWQLLDGDDEQGGLVLIGLLGLEDPGGRGGGFWGGGAHGCVEVASCRICSTSAGLNPLCAAWFGMLVL